MKLKIQNCADARVTPQMIAAGLEVYWDRLPVEAGKESDDQKKVVDIFTAMQLASSQSEWELGRARAKLHTESAIRFRVRMTLMLIAQLAIQTAEALRR